MLLASVAMVVARNHHGASVLVGVAVTGALTWGSAFNPGRRHRGAA
jgi:hypothetical protein